MAETMKAAVYHGKEQISIEEVPIPKAGPGEAIVKVSLTTICGTDVHIWRNEYPVAEGRIVGHEPCGTIHELGVGVTGYNIGDRVVVGAITPCGTCTSCLNAKWSQCVGYDGEWKPIGGWRLGNSMDGVQAEYFKVPYAQANLAKIPDELSDEDVVLVTDIASTGISGAESASVRVGDMVVVYAQGPIGLMATAGARLMGASFIIGVDSNEARLAASKRMGADAVINFKEQDPVAEVKRLTGGWGADVAIEALGQQETFENCMKSVHPGGTVSSLGVYAHDLNVPLQPFIYGIGDVKVVTTLCPGGKERMHRLMELVRTKRLNLKQLLTHSFALDDIADAYEFFAGQQDGVLKVAVYPEVPAEGLEESALWEVEEAEEPLGLFG
ncbi:MAG TPA: zinc-binding dehydrogenase [Armatimonadota bacterium]|nr:zinc-binding dehydrogenase [Armatimonadota bacterium]